MFKNKQSKTTKTVLGLCAVAAAGVAMLGTAPANASILFNRGLPIANLNNAAGSSRSNVAWADGETSNPPTNYVLPGDDFTLSGTGTYNVTDIRVWTVGVTGTTQGSTGLSLLGGNDGSPISGTPIDSSFTSKSITYTNNTTYQGSSGTYQPLYQVDFSVNLNLAAGQKYDFFVDGPWYSFSGSGGGYANTFLHASNAALSGSPQEGADGMFLWLPVNGGVNGTVETWYSGSGGGTSGFGSGWDKNSDANVQVFSGATPEPATLGLLSLGGLGLLLKRKRKAIA